LLCEAAAVSDGRPEAEGRAASAAWATFLKRHPDTQTIDLLIPDLAGIARGKRVLAKGLAGMLESGITFASSVYGMDATGTNVEASGLIWEEGDADRPCAFEASTFAPVPWREGGAQVLASLLDHDGRPFFGDPRAALARVAARFEASGLRPVTALELEFYLIERDTDEEGRPRPAARGDGKTAGEGQVYGIEELAERDAFLACLQRFAAAQDLPVKGAVSEYSPGQYEVNLAHVDDPVRAADHAFLFKRAIRAAARATGCEATFMAKPFAGRSSSGLHVHVSLWDRRGRNLLARDEQALRHAIAGLQATMAEAMLLFAPNANSYRRLRPLSYAPLAPTWGYNNRTVALRVIGESGAARRIEHRTAGADANPYLALAAVLAGVHHGLEEGLEPDAPIVGSAYHKVEPSLPLSWEPAIAALERAAILPGYMGADFCRLYRVCRQAERARFEERITRAEYAWYLRTV
jgi:glutamine synthetase